jgi:hypothetical protein
MDLTNQLGDAIKERRIITLRYAGTDFRIRPCLIKEMGCGDLALAGKTKFGEWREFAPHEIVGRYGPGAIPGNGSRLSTPRE